MPVPTGLLPGGQARRPATTPAFSHTGLRRRRCPDRHPAGRRLADVVLGADGIFKSKAYGERLLVDNLSFQLLAGGIAGVIVKLGCGDQSRDGENPAKPALQEITRE